MNCRVVVEAAVPVYDVETADEAVRIAISKTGEMLNPDLNYVEISMAGRSCPHCHEELEPAFIAADESLVALELEMTVFNVERDEHAARIARKEIGQRLENIPLDVLEIEELEDESTSDTDDETADSDDTESAANDDDASTAEDTTTQDDAGDELAEESDVGSSETESNDSGEGDSEPEESMDASPVEAVESSESDDDVLPEFEELIDE